MLPTAGAVATTTGAVTPGTVSMYIVQAVPVTGLVTRNGAPQAGRDMSASSASRRFNLAFSSIK